LSKKDNIQIGFIEAKDIGVSLDKTLKTEQLQRYLPALNNLILTDYLTFRLNGMIRINSIKLRKFCFPLYQRRIEGDFLYFNYLNPPCSL